jgi:pimeloyl-ACP methyl ester carboxylesterase
MKRLLLIVALLLSLVLVAQAQDVELVPFTDESFGVQGLVPDGWESRGFGSFARAESANDITALFIQSAPVPASTLLDALKGQLAVDEIPAPSGQIEGALTWDIRRIDTTIQGMDLSISLATAEVDKTSYLVLLQSLADEHDNLVETVFIPVVESIAPLAVAESTEEVPYRVEELSFPNGDIVLAGTLTIPEGEGPFPAVVLISGSGASDRDESTAPLAQIKPFRDIADYLSRNGIAVLRYDDRGVGESEGDAATVSLEILATDASAAVDFLVEREEFSAIGLIGHSEGGIIAPMVANTNENVAFVIGLGAPAVRMDALLLQQNRRLYAAMGLSDEGVEAIVAAQQAAFDAVVAGDDEALRLSVSQLIDLQVAALPEEEREALLAGASSDDLVELGISQYNALMTMGYFDWDVAAVWAEVEEPILAIYGELDVQVDSSQNAPALEEATAANEDVSILVLPTMNHILQEAETGAVQEYASLEQSVREDVLETISEWILERF